MARFRVRVSIGAALLSFVSAAPALAQGAPAPAPQTPTEIARVRAELDKLRAEFDSLRRAYDDRLQQLEQRLTQIGGGPMVVAPQTPVAPPVQQTPPVPQQQQPPPTQPDPQAPVAQPVNSGKVFNPDISVNGNFIAAAGRNPFATLSPLQLSERRGLAPRSGLAHIQMTKKYTGLFLTQTCS